MAIDTDGVAVTIWRREDWLYTARPGELETAIGKGKNGKVAVTSEGPVYAWQANGSVWVQLPGRTESQLVGPGGYPKLAVLADGRVLCVWEGDSGVMARLIN